MDISIRIPLYRIDGSIRAHVRISESDSHYISRFSWSISGKYAKRHVNGSSVKMHRDIMNCPDGMEVDHINGDPLDNRRSNLRICTISQNRMNHRIPKNNAVGVCGVSRSGRRYRAYISPGDCRRAVFRRFKTIEEAIQWRREAEILYHREFRWRPDR